MSDKSLIDEIQQAELNGASAEDKFAAKLVTCTDQEFARVSSYLCRLGDMERRRQASVPIVPREVSEEQQRLDAMDSAEFESYLASIGINSRLDVTLSDAMKRETKRRANGGE